MKIHMGIIITGTVLMMTLLHAILLYSFRNYDISDFPSVTVQYCINIEFMVKTLSPVQVLLVSQRVLTSDRTSAR